MTYDIVWYWRARDWKPALCGGAYPSADEQRDAIRKMGYVAHKGRKSIGPPEGPPSKEEIDAVLAVR